MEINDNRDGLVVTNASDRTEVASNSGQTNKSVAEFFAIMKENSVGHKVKKSNEGKEREFVNRNSMSSKGNRGSRNRAGTSNNVTWNSSSNDITEICNSTEWMSITSLTTTDAAAVLTNKKITNLQANLPEDMRISKLLRQLGGEKDPEQISQVCRKLRIAIEDATNSGYIRRSFDILADSIMRVFKEGPTISMNDVAEVFGLMGWVVRYEFPIYRSWIVRMFKVERIRIWVMRALEFTLRMDEYSRELRTDISNRLIELLKDYLENIDKADQFVAVTNVIQQFSLNYPKQFQTHFADIVDIVIGWHMETDQTISIKNHCSQILQSLKPFWVNDVSFTRNLLSQFLEDMINYRDEIQKNLYDNTAESQQTDICFGAIVGCTNSILKCIYDSSPSLSHHVGHTLLNELFLCVLEVTEITLELENELSYSQCNAIYMGANELTIILLDCMKYGFDSHEQKLIDVVLLQLQHLKIDVDSKQRVLAVLMVVLNIINVLKAKVSTAIMHEIFKSKYLLFSSDKQIQKATIKIYHAVLNLKNVEILQDTYKMILQDLQSAVQTLCIDEGQNEPFKYNQREAEYIISTHLSVLSTLALSNSSIIVLWGLQPTILEMLITHLKAFKYDELWYQYPETHYAILKLISAHCRNNNNFIASSTILNKKVATDDSNGKKTISGMIFGTGASTADDSPTSTHFELILKFMGKILAQEKLGDFHLIELLDWCTLLINQASQFNNILEHNAEFLQILDLIVCIAERNRSKKVIHKCSDCVLALLLLEQSNSQLFQSIAEICCIHMCSTDPSIRSLYSHILGKLPLNIALRQVNELTGLAKAHGRTVSSIQHWHSRKPIPHGGGEMRPQFFSDFIHCIRIKSIGKLDEYDMGFTDASIENNLQNMFIRSWAHSDDFDELEELAGIQSVYRRGSLYRQIAVNDIRSVISWAQWEAAQFCVNNKLRTVLGKPQETFLKIESIIKEDARMLSVNDAPKETNLETILLNQRQTRILLGFMEALEKAIYNASEGTAVALTPADKPARTFFHVNAPTCNEWFKRIRTAVDWVALHCMEPEMVIRYTESVLKALINTQRYNEPLFEHTLMTHAWALLRNGESDALHGLFVWTKSKTNKKVLWIKMAAEQAAGHLETAVTGYKSILETADEMKLDSHIREFLVDQTISCLYNAQQWVELRDLLYKEESRPTPRVTTPLLSIKSSQINDLIQQSSTGLSSLIDLADWDTLETKGLTNNFSYNRVISLAENTICKLSLLPPSEDIMLEQKCFSVIHSGLQECLRTKSKEHLNNLTILNHICSKLAQRKRTNEHRRGLGVDKSFGSITLMHLLNWANYLDGTSAIEEQSFTDLRLDVCSMTRKEGNLTYCRQQLEVFYNKSTILEKLNVGTNDMESTLDSICHHMINKDLSPHDFWERNLVRGVYETAKWMYCIPEKKESAIHFAAANANSIINYLRLNSNCEHAELKKESVSRTLLKLSEWLQPESDRILSNNSDSPLVQLVNSLDDIGLRNDQSYDTSELKSISTPIDLAVGKLISSSIKQCPELAKSWGAYGSWCYRWGRKLVELRAETDGLRNIDIASVQTLIPTASSHDIDWVAFVLNQHKLSADDEESIISNSDELSVTEIIESQLKAIPILSKSTSEELQKIIEIWRQAHKSVYSYYEMAAEAYFKYLQLTTQTTESSDEDCSTVTATLRILRLIVKHAFGLQDVLEKGLACTPSSPWKAIIPQLFSRLNHHEPYVRKRVSELLCRVARDSPNLIIFPAVVGAQEHSVDNIADVSLVPSTSDDDDDRNIETNSTKPTANSSLTACFNSLLDTLSKQACEPVSQVQLLVHELKRITFLWEERWLFTMAQVYSEYVKRITVFENDVKKALGIGTQESSAINKDKEKFEKQCTVFREKHRILMRPIVFVIERLHALTSQKPETVNENAFQEKYHGLIEETIAALKQPLSFEQFPQEGWQKFKQLYSVFQQRAQKRSACNLKMTDISPILANLRRTVISMPGIEHSSGPLQTTTNDPSRQGVHIQSVENIVHILPTKTKPKKLAFYGSNGRRYTYLFKGLEDLHLDERIMQFLSIANSMMTKSTDGAGHKSRYRAKHYSVIPLGPRSGLISWVDGMTPIFALYKKWQQRDATNPKKAQMSTSNKTVTTVSNPTILRPSELYYKKLTPLLAKHNLKVTDNRKDWPTSVLKEVLSALIAETPRDLLAKELWCCSTNAAEWRQVIRNYSQSIAVMSVIGYVIGLGDRHLDNILIDLASGEIVHIDYNVCFEKGKTLRVPEKVPFRMTPNLEEALGVTGIEGTFRLACEHVLKTLKRGRETLLTLLEAFVYDPLVDWAIGEDTVGFETTGSSKSKTNTVWKTSSITTAAKGTAIVGSVCNATEAALGLELRQARKQLQHEVTRDTLAIHFIEIRPDWIQNRDDVLGELQQLQSLLCDLQSKRGNLQKAEAKRALLSKQAALITEAESLGTAIRSHPLNTLSQRYGAYKRTRSEYNSCKTALLEKSNEYGLMLSGYLSCLNLFEVNPFGDHLLQLGELTTILKTESATYEFDLVKNFLDNSAQTAIYSQSCQISNELKTEQLQQFAALKQILDGLKQYVAVARYHPRAVHDHHRIARYSEWCSYLMEHSTVQDCRDIVTQFQTNIGKNALNKVPIQQVATFSYQLQSIIGKGQYELQSTLEALNAELNHEDVATRILQFSKSHEETKCAIKIYLTDNESCRSLLETVAMSRLNQLNTQLLTMHRAIADSTDNLTELTFNGKWFVDEFLAHSTLMFDLCRVHDLGDAFNHLVNTTRLNPEMIVPFYAMQSICNTYKHLCFMNESFVNITLSDILNGIISEDKSVLGMIATVSSLQEGLLPLAEIVTNLQLHLTNGVTAVTETTAMQAIKDAKTLESRLKELKDNFSGEEVLTKGQVLFMAFNGLFETLDDCYQQSIEFVQQISIPEEWKNIDHIRDSSELAAPILNQQSREILIHIFAVKRLEVMIEIFTLILQMACSFKGTGICPVFDDSNLCHPLKKYLSNYVWRLMLGIESYVVAFIECNMLKNDLSDLKSTNMDELYNEHVQTISSNLPNSAETLQQCQTLCHIMELSWQKLCTVNHLQQQVARQTEGLRRSQLLLSAHMWMYEEAISSQAGFTIPPPINRATLLVELTQAVQLLANKKSAVQKWSDELLVLTTAIGQRLKWAVGANPGLQELADKFNDSITRKNVLIESGSGLTAFALNNCTAVLKYEALRVSTADALEEDQNFLNLVSRWEKSCMMAQSYSNVVSNVEEALVELLDPEGPICTTWLNNVASLIDDMTEQENVEMNTLEKAIIISQDDVHSSAYRLGNFMLIRHRIATDVRALLQSIISHNSARDYFQKYKLPLDVLGDLHANIISKDLTESLVAAAVENISEIITPLRSMYDDLFELEEHLRVARESDEKLTVPAIAQVQQQDNSRPNSPSTNRTKPQKGQMEQKRNAYAVSVWRRIRMKLEGRDPDPTRRYTSTEQVDWMIREAMDPNNLAVLYEGWTPWV